MQTITIGKSEYILTIENMTNSDGEPYEYISLTGKRGAEYHVTDLDCLKKNGLYRAYSFGSFRDIISPKTGRPAILHRDADNFFTWVK
ncbi:hypothetical protein ACQR3W_21900 [Rhodococcus ruber]|uniref:Uncharacterized protein n=1 Tax=Rhodococcus ruber TaxID=1830 RepID=A0A098BJZ6_9NOCA|nr:hypothetical protein [Rhodococcus ruber]MCZ4533789.1 hypothetical protein [Rhodococcus ruber]CDZ89018.1 hypothetical protein RHRU231_450185 [Rhodococcus ruber]